ncbi:MAG: Na+/H+ antiporter subunit E [Alphaproteobacteria bacterium]|nr:Na+/H+ antiporter subunit E [Alphaproteobacteria bacterium]MBU1563379.1 Na+/H+ antiporter subunit E [Alphaproteobacteria bacterium]MBU2301132.1 Na+/H+ antiporter subunit E [Alphaproteobacteria bacterium]MBU2366847.1 Na+/H+ antiporter subunit E [Alphaproteobacteria bacterium]
MNPASIVIVLAIVWGAITGTFTGLNLLLGAAIGGVAVLLLRSAFAPPRILRKIGQIASLILLFIYELAASAVRVAIVVLTPSMKADLRPAIIAFPLTVKSDAEITLLANLITLTPGTLSIDVSEDRSVLFVHVLTLSTREALIADIAGGFEAKVREIYS